MRQSRDVLTNARLDSINTKLSTIINSIESQSYAIDYLIHKCDYPGVSPPNQLSPSPKRFGPKPHVHARTHNNKYNSGLNVSPSPKPPKNLKT
jgi:hypothetical protein